MREKKEKEKERGSLCVLYVTSCCIVYEVNVQLSFTLI